MVRGDVELQGGVDADQQTDGLDGQPPQPHRPHQRPRRLEHLGREGRGLSRDNIQVALVRDVSGHLLRQRGGRFEVRTGPGLRLGAVRDVGVEQGLDVVNKGVFDVNPCRLELEGQLRRRELITVSHCKRWSC